MDAFLFQTLLMQFFNCYERKHTVDFGKIVVFKNY